MTRKRDAGSCEAAAALGVSFAKPELLAEALTHGSVAEGRNNQRLEFLGDRVLGLIVATRLMAEHGTEDQGALARRFAALVSAATLAEVAREIALGQRMRMSASEEANGGRRKPTNLGDACEALIGALYLDGGLAAAARFVDRHWSRRIAAQGAPPVDAKTALQEWAQSRALGLPVYRTLSMEGPAHLPLFRVAVEIAGKGRAASASSSKRRAERAAAEQLLRRLQNDGG